MAKTFKVKSELREEKRAAFLVSLLFLLLSLLSFGLSFFMILFRKQVPTGVGIGLMIFGVIFFILYSAKRKNYMILRSGVNGENKVLSILQKLPNDFAVIANPVIDNRGKYNELDFVVIGKDAVFTVETKNYRGELRGKASDRELTQIKFGKGGGIYEKTVKNPIFQADLQGKRMRELLSDLNISCSVFSVLYFADESVKIDIINDKLYTCKIIKGENELLSYIQNTHGKRKSASAKPLIKVLKRK